jgi:Domain of unknown function (DUF1738).
MTNEQIILGERIKLMNEGIIGTTGKTLTVEKEGKKCEIDEPEVIHTYKVWQSLGFQVKRGEKARATILIWKHTIKKAKEEKDVDMEKMFKTKAFFFTAEQVEEIKQIEKGA